MISLRLKSIGNLIEIYLVVPEIKHNDGRTDGLTKPMSSFCTLRGIVKHFRPNCN